MSLSFLYMHTRTHTALGTDPDLAACSPGLVLGIAWFQGNILWTSFFIYLLMPLISFIREKSFHDIKKSWQAFLWISSIQEHNNFFSFFGQLPGKKMRKPWRPLCVKGIGKGGWSKEGSRDFTILLRSLVIIFLPACIQWELWAHESWAQKDRVQPLIMEPSFFFLLVNQPVQPSFCWASTARKVL